MHDPIHEPGYQKYIDAAERYEQHYHSCPECGKKLEKVGNFCPHCGADTTSLLPPLEPPNKLVSFLKTEVAFLAGLFWLVYCVFFLQLPILPPLLCNSACIRTFYDGETPWLRVTNAAIIAVLGTLGFGYFSYLTIINFPHKFVFPVINDTYTGGPLIICHAINTALFAWYARLNLMGMFFPKKMLTKYYSTSGEPMNKKKPTTAVSR